MPSYTHLRRAQPVLVSHFLLAHGAALRRDHGRLRRPARRDRRAAARVRRDRRHQLRDRRAGARGPPRDSPASSRNSIDATGERDFVVVVPARRVRWRWCTSAGLRRTSSSSPRRSSASSSSPTRAATGSSLMPQKKNPDPLELVRGKSGPRHRPAGRLAGDDEGIADRVQQGSAGGQGSGVRRRRHAARVAATPPRRSSAASDSNRQVTDAPRRRGCCSRPTSPTTWSRRGCRSATRTRSSARWCGGWSNERAVLRIAVARRVARALAAVRRATCATRSRRRRSVQRKRTPQSTHPDAVGGSLSEFRAWLRRAPLTHVVPGASRRRGRRLARSAASAVRRAVAPTPIASRRAHRRGGLKPDVIWHSGKLRARQTAEALWRHCNPLAEFSAARALQPDDPPEWIRDVVTMGIRG